jgi:murein DD-endopeptidase MepM/ murein hydrolase activator NlpD
VSFTIMHPLKGEGRISSKMGTRVSPVDGVTRYHNGTDIAAPEGTPVYAAADGEVTVVRYTDIAGNYITVKHKPTAQGEQFGTDYLHLSKIFVQKGQKVREGDVIGEVGTTGRSTGPHLHFNVQQYTPSRKWVNSEEYIDRLTPGVLSPIVIGGVVTLCGAALLLALYLKDR